jgi:hypothetical protein
MAKAAKGRSSPDGKPPWKRKRPSGARKTSLTPESRAKAKARAKRAGRPYPNLVDNMRAATEQRAGRKKTGAGEKTAKAKKTAGGRKKAA